MDKKEIYDLSQNLFSLTESEVDEYLKKFQTISDKQRLVAILDVAKRYCSDICAETDEKLKRKVGKVIFSKLDYSKFSTTETPAQTNARLCRLFGQITSKGINAYKVIYCSVLTDGNLRSEYDSGLKYYDKSRDFDNLYKSLVRALNLSKNEANSMFEKCTTLISKVSEDKFWSISNCLSNLTLSYYDNYCKLLSKKEVDEILKINPSLYAGSGEKIVAAFMYLQKKALAPRPLLPLYNNPDLNMLANRRQVLRSWIKNNSSLLILNADNMRAKEYFLNDTFNFYTNNDYAQIIEDVFHDRINLTLISQIPIEKIRKNAVENIRLLEHFASKNSVGEYIKNNPLVLGMKNKDLAELFKLTYASGGKALVEKFFEFGRTLFASNIDFVPKQICDKLVNNQVMIELDVENMKPAEYLSKFVEIFMDGDYSFVSEVETLIKSKQQRNLRGEKEIRKKIRLIGDDLGDLPEFLKDKTMKTKTKRALIFAFVEEIEDVYKLRLDLAEKPNLQQTKNVEYENNQKIEMVLNKLRNVFELKRFKIGKKYQNSDLLFEKMMDYLGQCFDDKEPLEEVFNNEISKRFKNLASQNFEDGPKQLDILGERVDITKVHPKLNAPLKTLAQTIQKSDNKNFVLG